MFKAVKRALLPLIILLVIATPVFAAIHFPELSGRVIDEAHILSPSVIAGLSQKLEDYERGTSNQLVIVTLASLGGYEISDYGYQLGRKWQIGQKGKDNGVLLIIAPVEHKVRIEVGYGLEELLTDAAASKIIHNIILPDFREGKIEQGVIDGAQAILDVLGGKSIEAQAINNGPSTIQLIVTLFFMFVFFRFAMRHPFLAYMILSHNSSRFSGSRSSGWSGGSGFRGGGGSFGGGGSSGSW
jgi:uncharacterized protein